MDILEITKKFPNKEACIKYLEKLRWENEPICVYCNSKNTCPIPKELRHHCKNCHKSFSVTVGTIFHNSHLDLQKWFLIISLMLSAKKGISACQLSRNINLRRPTVWLIMHKIRNAMKTDQTQLLQGIVEMDEAYVGGKPRKMANAEVNKRGRGTKKECVVGIVERNGNVKVIHTNKNELKAFNLENLVRKNVNLEKSILMTDEYLGYSGMSNLIEHFQINHQKAYVNGDIHTNTIEGFWGILKRGIIGQFHRVSKKYLQKYIDEFAFKYNNRKNDESMFNLLLNSCLSQR